MITYTDEEYENFLSYLGVDFKPRVFLPDGDAKLKYYLQNVLGAFDYDLVQIACKILFVESLENIPLYVNHDINVGNLGTVYLSKIAAWRLSRAK
jgi:hypothetical protein